MAGVNGNVGSGVDPPKAGFGPLSFGSWVQIGCGVVMILIGIAFGATAPILPKEVATGVKVGAAGLGNLLTIAGGVLISWVAATVVSQQEARQQLDEELDSVSRNLAQIYIQITEAVELGQSNGFASPETPLALISQAANLVHGQVTTIQAMRGQRFRGQPIVETKVALDELARLLGTAGDSEKSINLEKVREVIDEARADLSRLPQLARHRVEETVSCPTCATPITVMLGTHPGATASMRCPECHARFNVHRRGDLSIFVRELGRLVPSLAQSERREVTVTCACGRQLHVSYRADATSKSLVCTRCGTFQVIELATGLITRTDQFELVDAEVAGRKGPMPFCTCPVCSRNFRCAIHEPDEEAYFAYCAVDRKLMRVTYEARDAWGNGTSESID